jgi:hypothetical protein
MADFNNYGFSQTMGPQLRHEVERQLLIDLKHYHNFENPLRFDWSESSIEGKDASYMDGSLEKYSGISVFNDKMELVADGWMDFILTDRFIVYWEFLDLYTSNTPAEGKDIPGIPTHVWDRLTADEQTRLKGKKFEYFL